MTERKPHAKTGKRASKQRYANPRKVGTLLEYLWRGDEQRLQHLHREDRAVLYVLEAIVNKLERGELLILGKLEHVESVGSLCKLVDTGELLQDRPGIRELLCRIIRQHIYLPVRRGPPSGVRDNKPELKATLCAAYLLHFGKERFRETVGVKRVEYADKRIDELVKFVVQLVEQAFAGCHISLDEVKNREAKGRDINRVLDYVVLQHHDLIEKVDEFVAEKTAPLSAPPLATEGSS